MLSSEDFSDSLLGAALDALPYSIAVLDDNLHIVAVNRGWQKFGKENGVGDYDCLGVDYAEICRAAKKEPEDVAGSVLTSLGQLRREGASFQIDYECSSPLLKRWFTLVAARAGQYILMLHRETTLEKTVTSHRAQIPADLVALASGDRTPKFSPVNLTTLVRDIISARGVDSPATIHPNLWVLGDRDLLTSALDDLFNHCGQGLLDVTADGTEIDVIITLRDSNPVGNWANFGIEPFDWDEWDGGIGLPYARAVAQIHAGHLLVREIKGTAVCMVLPRLGIKASNLESSRDLVRK